MTNTRLSDLRDHILKAADQQGRLAAAREIVRAARERALAPESQGIFIHLANEDEIEARLKELAALDPSVGTGLALWGIPIAVKDNIDVAGMPTTAGCPAYAYLPAKDSDVVARLKTAGAVVLGKTNLDQFATGLVGTRSPYPIPANPFDSAIVPGGSSSGSACAVARGIVPLALGTDTAGSGRVPATLQGLWGFKSSVGTWSIDGVVPACKSIDCVTVFAKSAEDAALVHDIVAPETAARSQTSFGGGRAALNIVQAGIRVGIPQASALWFDGNDEAANLFSALRETWRKMPGVEVVEVDPAPFMEAAKMLYDGPWVSERWAQYGAFIEANPDKVVPVTKKVIEGGKSRLAADGWKAIYRMNDIKRAVYETYADIDAFVFPTIPRPYSRAELDADPIGINSRLGTYTNFMNLLDYCAVAFPSGAYASGFPHGATLFAPSGKDRAILDLAARFVSAAKGEGKSLPVAVCGAHMSGLALNKQLVELGGTFRATAETAAVYRMVLLGGGTRPGLVPAAKGQGKSFPLEIWDLPSESIGALLSRIPAPLGLGSVSLAEGKTVPGFVCADATQAEADISESGGWRSYLSAKT